MAYIREAKEGRDLRRRGQQAARPAPTPDISCPGADCFELLGRRWNAYLVWALLDGPRRFTQLLTVAEGVSDRMLTKRLRELEAAGIVTRHRYREVPPRVEYALTERGQALRPVIEAMERWGQTASSAGDPEAAAGEPAGTEGSGRVP